MHSRKYANNFAEINISDDTAAECPLNVHFLQYPVFHHCDTGFLRRYVNKYLFAHWFSNIQFFQQLSHFEKGKSHYTTIAALK